jgi:hypothetical protein
MSSVLRSTVRSWTDAGLPAFDEPLLDLSESVSSQRNLAI